MSGEVNKIRHAVIKAAETFTADYRGTLNSYSDQLDPKLQRLLYDLGADIKHAFDEISNQLKEK